jgi:hypothetical protein
MDENGLEGIGAMLKNGASTESPGQSLTMPIEEGAARLVAAAVALTGALLAACGP